MATDAAIIHFGEFFRRKVWELSQGRPGAWFVKHGLTVSNGQRYYNFREPLNIELVNQNAIAKATGYATWQEFDAAWRSTPVVPVPRQTPKWGASAAAAIAGGRFDFGKFTDEQLYGVIEEAQRELAERELPLERPDPATKAKPNPGPRSGRSSK